MKLIIRHSASLGWKLLAEVVIVLAVLLSLSRLVLPFANEFSDVIAEQMEEMIHYPVALGNIEASWAGVKPLIKLQDVTIKDDISGDPIARFDRLRVKVDPWQSLSQGRFVAETLVLQGSEIEIVRTEAGKLLFRGFEHASPDQATPQGASLEKLAGLTLKLQDINLLWNDQALKEKFEFQAEQLDLKVGSNSIWVDSQINLPQSLGEKVHFVARSEGPIENMLAWKSEVYIKGESIDIQGIPFQLPQPIPSITSGEVSLELWGDWTEEAGLMMRGDFNAHELRLEGDSDTGTAGRYEFIDNISANLKLRGKLNDWQLDLDQLDIVTARRHWPDTGLSLAYQRSEVAATDTDTDTNLQQSRWTARDGGNAGSAGSGEQWTARDGGNAGSARSGEQWTARDGGNAGSARSGEQWTGFIDFLDSGELLKLAALSPAFKGTWSEKLLAADPQGELSDFNFQTVSENSRLTGYRLAAVAEDFGWQQTVSIPGAGAVSGSFSLDQQGGDAVIQHANLDWDFRELFDSKIVLNQFSSKINWQRQTQEWQVEADGFQLANNDFTSTGTMTLSGFNQKRPRLDLELILPEVKATSVSKYLPYKKFRSEKTKKWFRQAFKQGTAKNAIFSYHGELSQSAFRNKKAKMLAQFDVEDTKIHYRDDWPDAEHLNGRVTFKNAELVAWVETGKILDANIGPVDVSIKDLFRSRLEIDGNAVGKASELLNFLQQSPLVPHLDQFLASVKAVGDAGLELGLRIPLSRKLKALEKPDVRGSVNLQNAALSLSDIDLVFNQVTGAVAFHNKNYSATGLTAQFRGGELMSSIKTDKENNILIYAQGDYPASNLLPKLKDKLDKVTAGSSLWKSRFTIPSKMNREKGEKLRLKVSSDLFGTQLLLPNEFAKPVTAQRDLIVDYELGVVPSLNVWLGKRIFLNADLNVVKDSTGKQNQLEFSRGILRLGDNASGVKPDYGLSLVGAWPVVNLQPWLTLSKRMRSPGDKSAIELKNIDLKMERFYPAEDLALNNVHLEMSQQKTRRNVLISSNEVAGAIDIPDKFTAAEKIIAKLDYLRWPKSQPKLNGIKKEKQTNTLDPASFPAINAEIQSVTVAGKSFGKVLLDTSPNKNGLEINSLAFGSDHYRAEVNGNWKIEDNLSKTEVFLQADASNAGAAIQDLGLNTDLNQGAGTVNGKIIWPHSPFAVDFQKLSGFLEVKVNQGKLANVEPGLGRLISLMSLNNLPRRLALNFKDLSEEGLYFDAFNADMRFNHGNLVMQDVSIESPLVHVDIKGETSLIKKQHDLTMEITPKIKSSLPVAAGLLAGPQTGALVFLVDKLAESMGVDFNKTAIRNYAVTGFWDNPSIDSLQTFAQESTEDSEDFLLQ